MAPGSLRVVLVGEFELVLVLLVHLLSVRVDVGDGLCELPHEFCLGIIDISQQIVEVLHLDVVRLFVLLHESCVLVEIVPEPAPLQGHKVVQEPAIRGSGHALPPLAFRVRFLLHRRNLVDDRLNEGSRGRRSRGRRSRVRAQLHEVQGAGDLAQSLAQRGPRVGRHHAFHLCLQRLILEIQVHAVVRAADADCRPGRLILVGLQEHLARGTFRERQDIVKDGEIILAHGEDLLVLEPFLVELGRGIPDLLLDQLPLAVVLCNPRGGRQAGLANDCQLGAEPPEVVYDLFVGPPVPLLELFALEDDVIEL
mmetsp:Transcript_1339/g.4543  ORF Transcript_1339/g.4543 Transcript_1339/m.4543 type:complete len:310 (-) Transcript_1339:459-1388(-)